MNTPVKAKKLRRPPAAVSLPFGGSSVMAGHAGQVVEGDDPETALFRALNYFPTPPWAARAGGELVRMLDSGARTAWEPASGEGHCAVPLEDYFEGGVWRTDVHDYGGPNRPIFLGDFPRGDFDGPSCPQVDWVITNPPFARAEAFAAKGYQVARRGVALLCRLALVESVGRHPLMCRKVLTAPFSERVPMQLGSWNPDLSSATAYAWFFWMKPEALAASPFEGAIRSAWAMDCTLERLIPPGTQSRLTQADDRVIFAGETPSSQLELAGVA